MEVNPNNNSKIKSVTMAQIIITESTIGEGTDIDPVRILFQYWDLKGNLLAQHDSENSLI